MTQEQKGKQERDTEKEKKKKREGKGREGKGRAKEPAVLQEVWGRTNILYQFQLDLPKNRPS